MPPEYYLLLITIFTTLVPSTNAADKYAPILAKAVNTRDLILNGKCKTGDMVELTKPFKSILKPEKYDSCIVDSAVGTRVSYEDFTGFSSSDVNQKIGAGLGVGVDAGVVSAKVKVDVDKSAREQETHTSATKIITLEVGTISLDQQCLQSRDFLDPQFVKDFTSLPTTNLMSLPDSTFPEWQSYIKFLSSWGTAYTTAVSKGGNVRIDIQTNDKITTTTTTVTVTIEVSVLWFHFSSSATHTDVDTKEKRDATVDLSVTGGSDGAKKAMMDRLQQIRDSFKSGSPPPDGNKNMTQDWVNSVSKEKFAQLTNGQFSTWDKFPMQFLFKTPEEQARVKSNFQIITSQYLNSHFAAPCSPQRFNFFTKTCEGVNAVKDALKYNIKVNLRTPDGECICKVVKGDGEIYVIKTSSLSP